MSQRPGRPYARLLLHADEPDRPPVHQDPAPAHQVQLLNLAAKHRLSEPLAQLLGVRVGVLQQVEPLAIDDQPHSPTIARTFEERT